MSSFNVSPLYSSHPPLPSTSSSSRGCDSHHGNRAGLEGCCHVDASERVGGILGLSDPLSSPSREEISVNDIREGAVAQPGSSPGKGGWIVDSSFTQGNWNSCWCVSANLYIVVFWHYKTEQLTTRHVRQNLENSYHRSIQNVIWLVVLTQTF